MEAEAEMVLDGTEEAELIISDGPEIGEEVGNESDPQLLQEAEKELENEVVHDSDVTPPVEFSKKDQFVLQETNTGKTNSKGSEEEGEDCTIQLESGDEVEREAEVENTVEDTIKVPVEVAAKSVRFNDVIEVSDKATQDISVVPKAAHMVAEFGEVVSCREPVLDVYPALDIDVYECKHVELNRWEAYGVSRPGISSLTSDDLAACFSAFLMHHRASRSAAYIQVKAGLMVLFREKFVDGDVLVGMSSNQYINNGNGYVTELRRSIESTLEAIDGVGKQCGLQYRIDLFFEKLAPVKPATRAQEDQDANVTGGCCGLGRLFRRNRKKHQ